MGRWLWVRIEGKDNKSTGFIPAYRHSKTPRVSPLYRISNLNIFRKNIRSKILIFISFLTIIYYNLLESYVMQDITSFLAWMQMMTSEEEISKALEEISMFKVILKFDKDKSPPNTCTTNTNCKIINNFCTSPSPQEWSHSKQIFHFLWSFRVWLWSQIDMGQHM